MKKGDRIQYRAIAGDCYPGKVVSINDDGTVGAEIECGTSTPNDSMFLGRLTVHKTKRGCVWPKGK
jgi:hypothetical protein